MRSKLISLVLLALIVFSNSFAQSGTATVDTDRRTVHLKANQPAPGTTATLHAYAACNSGAASLSEDSPITPNGTVTLQEAAPAASSVCVIEHYGANRSDDHFGPALVPGDAPGATLEVRAVPGLTSFQVIPLVPPPPGATLSVFADCNSRVPIGLDRAVSAGIAAGQAITMTLFNNAPLTSRTTLCVVESYSASLPFDTSGKVYLGREYDSLCHYAFNDCDWRYTALAGFEQSDLSSQGTQTDPFVDFIVRAPVNVRSGSVWLRARLLGVPTTANTQNITSIAANASTAASPTTLTNIANSIDYIMGYQYDVFKPSRDNPGSGQTTLGFILGFGATTPVTGLANTQGFAVPAYGTNECNTLHTRLGPGNGYATPLPSAQSVTTTTTVGSAASTSTTQIYCVVQNTPNTTSSTVGGTTTTVVMSATPQTNIAFSPEDRSSFLLKYAAGVRLITRFHSGASSRCSNRAAHDTTDGTLVNGVCTRDIVDFTVGQDQAITGGYFHSMVFKSDAILPIKQTGITLFLSASIRARGNKYQDPLILNSTPISTGAGSAAGAVTIPSPSVFVLPLKQSDRDFYRIGLAIDLDKVLPKLFQPIS